MKAAQLLHQLRELDDMEDRYPPGTRFWVTGLGYIAPDFGQDVEAWRRAYFPDTSNQQDDISEAPVIGRG